jgi:hypothetical protein
MPPLTRWLLRAALLHLVAALALGLARAWPGLAGTARAAALAPVAVHLLMVGWVTQMIVGVAYWMFPRPSPGRSHGPAWLGWVAFAGLNGGVLLRAVAEPAVALGGAGAGRSLLVVASALQLAGVLAAVALLWPRLEVRE